jgi:20S proteasome alpha/beta subunit
MSIIVSVKINDGIVMASDSATTFAIGQIYEHANKIVNLVKGLSIGVMTCGAGGIGNASIATLLKDLRQRLSGHDETHEDWKLDPKNYTMESVNSRMKQFFTEKVNEAEFKQFLLLRLCGYSSGHLLPEVWQVAFNEGTCTHDNCVQSEDSFGLLWNGEQEALNRMILGVGTITEKGAEAMGSTLEKAVDLRDKLIPHTYETLILTAAPIQDAINLTRFLVETTAGFIQFSVTRQKTVGGPTEIAAITKHEGFKWVQRKHFYSSEFNLRLRRHETDEIV